MSRCTEQHKKTGQSQELPLHRSFKEMLKEGVQGNSDIIKKMTLA
jgi:hypothetical protein